jgi:hypothetical protein
MGRPRLTQGKRLHWAGIDAFPTCRPGQEAIPAPERPARAGNRSTALGVAVRALLNHQPHPGIQSSTVSCTCCLIIAAASSTANVTAP